MGCFSRPCQDSFALFYEDGLSMTVRYRGHHCTQLRLGVVSPVGRDGRPPTLIRVGPRTEREQRKLYHQSTDAGGAGMSSSEQGWVHTCHMYLPQLPTVGTSRHVYKRFIRGEWVCRENIGEED